MTMDAEPSTPRSRGSIRRMRDRVQVRVSAGDDPSTGERIILVDSVMIENPGNERSERAALKEAEKLRTKMLADADALKVGRTSPTVEALLERWLEQHEIDPTTRMNYESQIRRYIVPNLGDVPLVLFVRDTPERLEKLYSRPAQVSRALLGPAVHRARLQPDVLGEAAAEEAPAAAAADERADGAHRRGGRAVVSGVGAVPLAVSGDRRAPR